LELTRVMSALCQKRTYAVQQFVRFMLESGRHRGRWYVRL